MSSETDNKEKILKTDRKSKRQKKKKDWGVIQKIRIR